MDHLLSLLPAGLAVQEEDFNPKLFLQLMSEHRPHAGELSEYQGPVTNRNGLVEHLLQTGQLSGAALQRASVLQEERRVVADLFELGQCSQNLTSALHSFRRLDPG